MTDNSSPIRVMIVDDSAIIRGLFNKALSTDADIKIVASAGNGKAALLHQKEAQPDVILLDIEMPEMDGMTALPQLLQAQPGVCVIMVSSLTLRNASISLQALQMGALDYIPKPSSKEQDGVEAFYRELLEKTKVHGHKVRQRRLSSNGATGRTSAPASQPATSIYVPPSRPTISKISAVAIASSTGGPQALQKLFEGLKGKLNHLPIFITQHMPPNFTAILAEHLSKNGDRIVVEGKEGQVVEPGVAYVAPGDYHMVMKRSGTSTIIHVNKDAQENFCRPAADPMLRSLAPIYGSNLLVVVLTGMGSDGMLGAKVVVDNGGHVVAQNEETCVVYGMPKAVVEQKLCSHILPLADIAPFLIRTCV